MCTKKSTHLLYTPDLELDLEIWNAVIVTHTILAQCDILLSINIVCTVLICDVHQYDIWVSILKQRAIWRDKKTFLWLCCEWWMTLAMYSANRLLRWISQDTHIFGCITGLYVGCLTLRSIRQVRTISGAPMWSANCVQWVLQLVLWNVITTCRPVHWLTHHQQHHHQRHHHTKRPLISF